MSSVSVVGDTILYIRQSGSTYEYSNDSKSTWNAFTFPLSITNLTPPGLVTVLFETDISITSPSGYFVCSSSDIQFGSQTLESTGLRPVITIDSVTDYPGLIRNGTSLSSGYDTISVYNLIVDGTSSTTSTTGGWIGQSYFGNGIAAPNNVIHCTSIGPINQDSGGIVGGYAAINATARVIITGCTSSGSIATAAGGILGSNSGSQVTISRCSSSGVIGTTGGGIAGYRCGTSGPISISECYSTGLISPDSGGIIGPDSSAVITTSYSEGAIAISSGGIFGSVCTGTATNCYSGGTVGTPGCGIFGPGSATVIFSCYVADGTWSDTSATSTLLGVPTGTLVYGTTWCQPNGLNTTYRLTTSDYSPYSLALTNTASDTIVAGGAATPAALVPGYSYAILAIDLAAPSTVPSITINATTGRITATSSTPAGTYVLQIYSTKNPYGVTEYTLTVSGGGGSGESCCTLSQSDLQGLDYTTRAEVTAGFISTLGPRVPSYSSSYSDRLAMKLAKSFVRF